MIRVGRRQALLLPALLASCAVQPVTSVDGLPGFSADSFATLVNAPSDEAARAWLRTRFRPQTLPRLRFTGYFEISVPGSRLQGGAFTTPLLRRPRDAQAYDRAAIMAGALAGRGLEIAWLRSPADLFFVQMQGSGRITLAEGGEIRLTSAGSNGRPSLPAQAVFGAVALDPSIPGLQAWATAHPAAAAARIAHDPSYVFFREAAGGPGGSAGRPLLPLRTLAVDPAVIPMNALVWIDVSPSRGPTLRRLMVAQDTGVHGAAADIFFGSGPEAEEIGGHLYTTGNAWLLTPVV